MTPADLDQIRAVVSEVLQEFGLVRKVNGVMHGLDEFTRIPLEDGSDFWLDIGYLNELERAYPAVDLPATLLEIRAWCLSNPGRCKTKRGVKRFINGWFAKEQRNGS